MLLRHGLELTADDVERDPEAPHLLGAQRLAAQRHELTGILILDRGSGCQRVRDANRRSQRGRLAAHLAALTVVEGSQLIARLLRSVHALEQGTDASVLLAPEVVRNWQSRQSWWLDSGGPRVRRSSIQERATLGPSAVAAGIVPGSCERGRPMACCLRRPAVEVAMLYR